jgi:hypothetical protein
MYSKFSFAYFVLGALAGVGLCVATSPLPMQKNSCETYFVAHKVATSYVLRPPPSEPSVCPAPQVTKCPDIVSKEEITKADDTKAEEPRRHRRRYRRYWR